MYNPSNHIPLSKAMGAVAFPLDGKFMYFTNGANGVYRYRPFQSIEEVLEYFPLGSPFRGDQNGQSWSYEILINDGGTLSSDGGSIVGGENTVYWFRNGVSDADLVKKVSDQTGESVQKLVLVNPTITDGYVSYGLTGTQVSIAEISKDESGNTLWTEAGGAQEGRNVAAEGNQTITVFYVGEAGEEPVPPQAIYNIYNGSAQNVEYKLQGVTNTLTPNTSAGGPTIPGQSIQVSIVSGQYVTYGVYDLEGNAIFGPNNTDGPATVNGIPMTDNRIQEFFISNPGTDS